MDMDARTKITLVWSCTNKGSNARLPVTSLSTTKPSATISTPSPGKDFSLPGGVRYGTAKVPPSRQVPVSVKQRVWFLRTGKAAVAGKKIAYF